MFRFISDLSLSVISFGFVETHYVVLAAQELLWRPDWPQTPCDPPGNTLSAEIIGMCYHSQSEFSL